MKGAICSGESIFTAPRLGCRVAYAVAKPPDAECPTRTGAVSPASCTTP